MPFMIAGDNGVAPYANMVGGKNNSRQSTSCCVYGSDNPCSCKLTTKSSIVLKGCISEGSGEGYK